MTNPFGIQQRPESIRVAKELVSIATNTEFGDLRNEMVERLLMRKIHGEIGTAAARVEVLMAVLELVLLTVEVQADDIAKTGELRNLLDVITTHPEFAQMVKAAEAEQPRILRRSSDIDDDLRERDQ
ncbi:hypothetical protein [Microbacterium sp. SD291]|uniref:hypothetical protein n=1 Tax=Microbacterium sp. SD291 TaxID=2782007 RepID=UPI001A95BB1C|nr:hypothetical protein [Microbacterium sp. SD291]MBO0979902.1 hypothetical protein [Microbacterium sp. SD291]